MDKASDKVIDKIIDKIILAITANLFPLWMVGANLIARLGGMIILLLIGHGFAPDILGGYFAILAMTGLAVTATQAGTGPLLIRLVQTGAHTTAILVVTLRLLVAFAAIALLVTRPEFDLPIHWPFVIMPIAAALSPDWIITARTAFSRLGQIAVIAQLAGIGAAFLAVATNNNFILFTIAPAISVAAFTASICFAARLRSKPQTRLVAPAPDIKQTCGLIGFTLLAGFLPNLDFVLLGDGSHALFLAQRVFLFCAGLITAIAATLFAKRQEGPVRECWLFVPMASVTILLLFFPDLIAHLIYAAPDMHLVAILRTGAFWPLLLAIIIRQCLVLQESGRVIWLGWLLLILLFVTLPLFSEPMKTPGLLANLMIIAQIRLGVLCVILAGCQVWLMRKDVRT